MNYVVIFPAWFKVFITFNAKMEPRPRITLLLIWTDLVMQI